MTETEKISYEDILKTMADNDTEQIDWNGMTITVKKHLDFGEMIRFTNSVADTIYDEEDGTYLIECFETQFMANILMRYTNIDIPLGNSEAVYNIVYGTDLVQKVFDIIGFDEVDDIRNSIKQKIKYSMSVEKRIADVTAKVHTAFDSIGESIGNVFSDISNEDMKKLVSALSSTTNIDEAKIVEALANKKYLHASEDAYNGPSLVKSNKEK